MKRIQSVFITVFYSSYNARDYYNKLPELRQAIDQVDSGYFSPEDPNMFKEVSNMLMNHDRWAGISYQWIWMKKNAYSIIRALLQWVSTRKT